MPYEAPNSLEEAVQLLERDAGSKVLAGGTDLLVQVRGGAPSPSAWIDIKRIPELNQVQLSEDGLRLGAAVPAAVIFENEEIRQRWPGVAEATDLIGSTQIQGRATLGGNLCNSSPAADTTPALIASQARCVIAGPKGERTVEVADFVTGPGQNVLGEGELLVAFELNTPPARCSDAYLRLIPRTEMDIAVVGAGVSLTLADDGTCSAARVAIGAVAPTALLVPASADALIGSRLDAAALDQAAEAASAVANPIDDKRGTIAYRRRVTGVLVKRAAAIAHQRAQER
ncbi:xanthine dehydrogenase family protein subunit M [Myxococcota bacterium]|nr:xanthine dehydrogenase family protein subunit M [Myxococcota bacterium]